MRGGGYLDSRRLRLVPASIEITDADLAGREALARALNAAVPDNWPPELYDGPAVEFTRTRLRDRAELGWSTWYLLWKDPEPVLIGVCGFKGRPDTSGSVEIAYSIPRQFRAGGLATEAVNRLVQWAFTHPAVREVCAETMPHLLQSIRVLEKNGFRRSGAGSERGVIRYAISRENLSR